VEQPSAVEHAASGRAGHDLSGAEPDPTSPSVVGSEAAAFPVPGEPATEQVTEPVPVEPVAVPPVAVPDHGAERRPRGRRVVRVVRRVQLWSVFKVALLSFLVFYVITLLAAAAVWSLANSTGQVHHLEKFMRDIGFDNWTFNGGRLFSATAFSGAVLVVAASVFTTLAAALLNLISELTGGIRFIVIEDVEPTWSEDLHLDDDLGDDEIRQSRRSRRRPPPPAA
jgi:hypothetical protein